VGSKNKSIIVCIAAGPSIQLIMLARKLNLVIRNHSGDARRYQSKKHAGIREYEGRTLGYIRGHPP
jgi:hypothetical protein